LNDVATVRYSARAEADFLDIGKYTLRTWGIAQADRYLAEIEECCPRVGQNPLLGRACGTIQPGLRRIEQGRHVIFYRVVDEGILVSRILHQAMLPRMEQFEEDI
jgi:toxin ParE1/3/4